MTPREQLTAAFSDALDALASEGEAIRSELMHGSLEQQEADDMVRPIDRAYAVLAQVRDSVLDREIGFTDEHMTELVRQADEAQRIADEQTGTGVPLVADDGSKSIGVTCCDKSFATADEAKQHEQQHQADADAQAKR
jgi:hypothetical protein